MTNFDQMSDAELQAMIQKYSTPPPVPAVPTYTAPSSYGTSPPPYPSPPSTQYVQSPPSAQYTQSGAAPPKFSPPRQGYPQPPSPQYGTPQPPTHYASPPPQQFPPSQPYQATTQAYPTSPNQYSPNGRANGEPVHVQVQEPAPIPPSRSPMSGGMTPGGSAYFPPPPAHPGGYPQAPVPAPAGPAPSHSPAPAYAPTPSSCAVPTVPVSTGAAAMLEKAKNARAVDVCFVVDCTGSMTHWIQQVKDKVLQIVKGVKSHPRVKDVRLGFVGYRDYFYPADQRYVVVPFIEDEVHFEKMVRDVQALYCKGNDEPEDLLGGLDQALRLDWKSKTRIIILITDAPCHGQQYHTLEESSQNANYHDPFKPETLLRAMGTRFNIDLTFCRIKADTDLMISKFKPLYDDKRGSGRGLKQIELNTNVDDFLPKMVQTITESVNKANR